MNVTDDTELLRQFARENSETAFRELVGRRIGFVYAAALRQTNGDATLAQDVTQTVFVDLARKARALGERETIAGWLFMSTRFAAAKAVRARLRRQIHETEAQAMQKILAEDVRGAVAWDELRPVIDEALAGLGERDREAILLRFFEGRSLAEVGRCVGLAENSARMRVERALEKLRERLAKRGITSTAAALGAAMAAQPIVAAPAGLAVAVGGAALTGVVGASGGGAAIFVMKFLTKQKLAATVAVVVLGGGAVFTLESGLDAQIASDAAVQRGQLAGLVAQNGRTQAENDRSRTEIATRAVSNAATPAAERRVRLRAVMEMMADGKAGMMRWVSYAPVSPVVTPAVAELFDLSASEAAAVEQAVEAAKNEIAAIAVANARVRREGNVFAADLQPTDESRASFGRMLERLRAVLGEERFGAYRDIGWGEAVERLLNNLGLSESTLTITHVANPRRPNMVYEYFQERTQQGARGGGGGSGSAVGDLAEIRKSLGPLGGLVPSDL